MAEPAMQMDEALARLDAMRRQVELGSRNLEFAEAMLAETRRAHATLVALASANEGDEILLPVGASTFVTAKVTSPSSVLLGVGSGYSAQRPTQEAAALLEQKQKDLESECDRIGRDLMELRHAADELQDAIESAMGQGQQPS